MLDRRILVTATMIGLAAGTLAISSSTSSELKILPAGDPITLYDWSSRKCTDEFIPDAPARAFRRADGRMTLIATHRTNWSLSGANFDGLTPSCESILDSSKQPPRTGRLWIEATYTADGQTVVALVSQDLNHYLKDAGCDPRGERGRCWLNHILAAESTDMGASFKLLPPEKRTVASLGDVYPDANTKRLGVFTTSNIVKNGNNYFMFAYAQGENVQKTGNCLFRTSDPLKPKLWRAWDGTSFSIDMSISNPSVGCPPITGLPTEVRSLSYLSKYGRWVAVFASQHKLTGDQDVVPGFYYSISRELFNWSKPLRITAAPLKPREQNSTHIWAYPSLLDRNSRSKNFDTIDNDDPVLLFTYTHLNKGNGTMNRDLRYLPISINATD